GCIHLFFEGHFVLNHEKLVSLTDLISQEWKEYAKSDSRYLHSDSFVLAIETITTFVWAPLCFYIALATTNRFPSRHVWTALMCFAHIYGNALYYGTTFIQGCPDSRPEFLYFWVYFIGLNGIWLITPIGESI
ncbi:3-beta-hydroxysteroid-Delta(8),Delta(7)-isomerase, partial [Leucoagaricus sp. SymC.cos]